MWLFCIGSWRNFSIDRKEVNETLRLDRKMVLGLFLVVSLLGTAGSTQGVDLHMVDYTYWAELNFVEKVTYVNGAIGASYALSLIYMEDNPGLGGPDLFQYAPLDVTNWRLVELINQVYTYQEFRKVPVAAIIMNFRYWISYLRR